MPTAKGKEEIDAFHPLYGLHYLERKPMQDFLTGTGPDRSKWLQIEKGKVGLVRGLCCVVFCGCRRRERIDCDVDDDDDDGREGGLLELFRASAVLFVLLDVRCGHCFRLN